jgi:hypothetical protein
MKCKICGSDSNQESLADDIDYNIATSQKDWICWNCCYETTYNSYKIRDTVIKEFNKGKRISSEMFTTIEYLLICIECQHQTGYGYLWFAIQDGREHVLSS